MKAIITNHHCDSRNVTIPGTRQIIKLPAFASINVNFASERQMQDFSAVLSLKAPAAQMIVISPKSEVTIEDLSAAVDTDPDDEAGEDIKIHNVAPSYPVIDEPVTTEYVQTPIAMPEIEAKKAAKKARPTNYKKRGKP